MKDNFLAVRVFYHVADLNWKALEWCNWQNGTYHRVVDGAPQQIHGIVWGERLHTLPETESVQLYLCAERRISFDGFVNYEGRRFGVPYSYPGATARVERSGDTLYIYSVDLKQLLSTHDVTWIHMGSFCEGQSKALIQAEEFAQFVEDQELTEAEMEAVRAVFSYLSRKKQQTTIQTLSKMSRLPTKAPKTFENFDFSLLKGKDVERLRVLPSPNAIYSHRNLAFIGPAGTGKTHLAQAFGYACCQHGLKTYFKTSELRDRFAATRRYGKTDSCLNGLVRPSCLIVDELGHCAFDKENTRLFFDLIDRRYNKEGNI